MYTACEAAVPSINPTLLFKERSVSLMVFIKSAMDCTSTSPDTFSMPAGGLGGRDFLLDALPLFLAAGADILLVFAFGGIFTIQRERRTGSPSLRV